MEQYGQFGYNYYGEAGTGGKNTGSSAASQGIKVARQAINENSVGPLDKITEVSAGGYHVTARSEAKKAYVWGFNGQYCLGLGDTTLRVVPTTLIAGDKDEPLTNVKYINATQRGTRVLLTNGEYYVVGRNSRYQLAQKNNTDVTRLSRAYDYTRENYIDNILSLKASGVNDTNTAVIKKDGTVWIAGQAKYGELGNGTFEDQDVYVRMGTFGFNVDKYVITLAPGESEKITPSVMNGFNVYDDEKDGMNTLEITSSNNEIATVDANGNVTAVKFGNATITLYDKKNLSSRLVYVEVTRDNEETVQAEIATSNFSALLKGDGTVETWGLGTSGQLGNGKNDSSNEPVSVLNPEGTDILRNVTSVDVGLNHGAALLSSGEVVAWGHGGEYQLGNRSNSNSNLPVYVVKEDGQKLTDITRIDAGRNFTLAVRKDGTVWGWGTNSHGVLAQANRTSVNYAVQLKDTTGTGYIQNAADVVAMGYSSFVITHDKTIYGCGYNYNGELGLGYRTNSSYSTAGRTITLPRLVPISDVEKLIAGLHHIVALKADGSVWTWGYNGQGQLSDGTTSNRYSPQQMKWDASTVIEGVEDISARHHSSYIKLKDGRVFSCGYNGSNALGNNNTTNQVYPVQAVTDYNENYDGTKIAILPKGIMIDASGNDTVAYIQKNGNIIGSGTQNNGNLLNTRTGTRIGLTELQPDFMEINTRSTTLKKGESTDLSVSVRKNLNAYVGHIKLSENIEWTSSNLDAVTVDQNGMIIAVGLGEAMITATDKTNGYIAKCSVYAIQDNEKAVAVPSVNQGDYYTLILKADGTVWATGLNANGQLGDGTTADRTKPVQVKTDSNTYLTNVVKISAGNDHALALTKSGKVYAWGNNNVGQLGNGTSTRSLYAKEVLNENGSAPISNIIDISTGSKRSYILDDKGEAYSFGYGYHGALAHQSNSNSTLPTKILESENTVRVIGANAGIALLMGDGSIKTAGYNNYGTIGQNYRTTSGTHRGPSLVGKVIDTDEIGVLKGINKIVSSGHTYVAMRDDGKAYVWGWNSSGEFGNGTTGVSAKPIELTLPEDAGNLVDIGASWKNISVKMRNNIQTETGTKQMDIVYVAGLNENAQLGIGNKTNQVTFVPVQDETGTDIAKELDIMPKNPGAGATNGYIDLDGHVWTVGLNGNGQLGDDTLYQRYNIVKVGEVVLKTEDIIMDLIIGEEKTIKTSIEDTFNVYIKDPQVGNLEFTSLDPDIATVDNTGKVTGKSTGNVLIKVKDITNNLETAVYVKVTSGKSDMKYTPMVDGGAIYSAALKGDGTVWTWGNNDDGELGNNSTEAVSEPEQVVRKRRKRILRKYQNDSLWRISHACTKRRRNSMGMGI